MVIQDQHDIIIVSLVVQLVKFNLMHYQLYQVNHIFQLIHLQTFVTLLILLELQMKKNLIIQIKFLLIQSLIIITNQIIFLKNLKQLMMRKNNNRKLRKWVNSNQNYRRLWKRNQKRIKIQRRRSHHHY